MRSLLAAAAAVLLLSACTSTAASDDAAPAPPAAAALTYVALGDSVAAGVGARTPRSGGYVPLLADLLREQVGCGDDCPLAARNLAVSGATTDAVVQGQLPRLRSLLGSGPPVRLVTLTVGGNDVFVPVLRACALATQSPACRTAAADAVLAAGRGVDAVLDEVRALAPDAVVAVMAYYDPLPACRLAALSPLAVQVLEGAGDSPGLNDVLRTQAATYDAVVVETRGLLTDRADLVGGSDCLHPSDQGHAEIAQAFLAAVQGRLLPG